MYNPTKNGKMATRTENLKKTRQQLAICGRYEQENGITRIPANATTFRDNFGTSRVKSFVFAGVEILFSCFE